MINYSIDISKKKRQIKACEASIKKMTKQLELLPTRLEEVKVNQVLYTQELEQLIKDQHEYKIQERKKRREERIKQQIHQLTKQLNGQQSKDNENDERENENDDLCEDNIEGAEEKKEKDEKNK